MKKLILWLVLLSIAASARAAPMEAEPPFALKTPSYLLMEASTGQVILEQGADERRPVASVTKLMTLLLVLEALEAGEARLDEPVTCSRTAAGMGGSQALLDGGAVYPFETLLKSTIIASANDSAVALAEHLAGSEAAFVQRMNARAASLGMENTQYQNCTGLPAQGQYTTARDVATVSREVGKHPLYFQYSTIWMDTLTHPGGRTTDLTNTNRLVRFYSACDGFKTGSTNEAKYCLSATAVADGMRLIAVVLGTPASQTRFDEARKLLEHGFSQYRLVTVCEAGDHLGERVSVTLGAAEGVEGAVGESYSLLVKRGGEGSLRLEAVLPDSVKAPVARGDILGELRVMDGGALLRTLPIVAAESVGLPGYLEALLRMLNTWR